MVEGHEKHYTIFDAAGHMNMDFIRNTITGASQADVALFMVPGDENFCSVCQREQARQTEAGGRAKELEMEECKS